MYPVEKNGAGAQSMKFAGWNGQNLFLEDVSLVVRACELHKVHD